MIMRRYYQALSATLFLAALVLAGMLAGSQTKRFFLRVDREVSHGRTVWTLDLAKQGGAADISLME